tara:strand:- start:57 stop:335 length:279 start_codon:yes stop_codon:yes gene_type:complete
MLRHFIRRLNTALKEDHHYYIKIKEFDSIYLPPTPKLAEKLKNNLLIAENTGSICQKCFGSGWITDNKSKSNIGLNFKFTICKNCNGTGFGP